MKSLIYYLITLLIFIIATVGYEFKLYPLMFKLNNYKEALGWLLLFAGVILIVISYRQTEYMKGYKDALKDALELYKKPHQ